MILSNISDFIETIDYIQKHFTLEECKSIYGVVNGMDIWNHWWLKLCNKNLFSLITSLHGNTRDKLVAWIDNTLQKHTNDIEQKNAINMDIEIEDEVVDTVNEPMEAEEIN